MEELVLGLDNADHRDQTFKTKLWWKPIGLNFCNMRVSVMSLERSLYITDLVLRLLKCGASLCAILSQGNHRRHQWETLGKSWCCPGVAHILWGLCLCRGTHKGPCLDFRHLGELKSKPNGTGPGLAIFQKKPSEMVNEGGSNKVCL